MMKGRVSEMNSEEWALQPALVLERWDDVKVESPETFVDFFRAVASKDRDLCSQPGTIHENRPRFILAGQRPRAVEVIAAGSAYWSLTDYPQIISRFLEFAEPKVAANTDDADFWIAVALALSDSKQVWDFLIHQTPSDAIERTNELDFFRSLSQRFPDIEWFLNEYHASLTRHPDSRLTQQALLDAEELSDILVSIYPQGTGRGLHKRIRQQIRKEASARFASFPVDEQRRVIRLCLDRYFLMTEQPIRAHGSCPVDHATHELILCDSEPVWRGLLESDLHGLWRERLHRNYVGHQVDFFGALRREYPPHFPHQRKSFDYQHSSHDERVWNRYLSSISAEFGDLVPAWFGYWHNVELSRSSFMQDTDVLVQQIEETQILLEAVKQIYQRRPNLGKERTVDGQSRELEKLKQYFLSGETLPIDQWFRKRYSDSQ
jgi:hypothetical protein